MFTFHYPHAVDQLCLITKVLYYFIVERKYWNICITFLFGIGYHVRRNEYVIILSPGVLPHVCNYVYSQASLKKKKNPNSPFANIKRILYWYDLIIHIPFEKKYSQCLFTRRDPYSKLIFISIGHYILSLCLQYFCNANEKCIYVYLGLIMSSY